jgi:hypothetical protein
MAKFIAGVVLFFVPPMFLLIFPFYIYREAREFTSIDRVIEAQNGARDVLFGLAYSNFDKTYKSRLIAARNPKIIALGNSRVMEFRKEFFRTPTDFANAGGAATSLRDAISFVQSLPEDGQNRVIIFGLYPTYFQPATQSVINSGTLTSTIRSFFAGQWRRVYVDFFSRKFSLSELSERARASPSIGLNALINHDGYLNDGSYYYGKEMKNSSRVNDLETGLEMGLATLEKSSPTNNIVKFPEENFRDFQTFLTLCKKKKVYVISYMPPNAYSVSGKEGYSLEPYITSAALIIPQVRHISAEYGFPVFDYTNTYTAGVQASEFVDADHPSDKADLRMLIDMANRDQELARYVNLPSLRALLANAQGDFIVTEPHP